MNRMLGIILLIITLHEIQPISSCGPQTGQYISIFFQRLIYDIQSLLSPSGGPRKPKPEYPPKAPLQYGQNTAIGQNPNPQAPFVGPQGPGTGSQVPSYGPIAQNPGFQTPGFIPQGPASQQYPNYRFPPPSFLGRNPSMVELKTPFAIRWRQMRPAPPCYLVVVRNEKQLEKSRTCVSSHMIDPHYVHTFKGTGEYTVHVVAADQSERPIGDAGVLLIKIFHKV